jgi:hypothetical protein
VALPGAGPVEDVVRRLAATAHTARSGLPAGPELVVALPDQLDDGFLADRLTPAARPWKLPIGAGVTRGRVEPVFVDLGEEQLLLVYGPSQCGKSRLLRRLAELVHTRWKDEVAVYGAAPRASSLRDFGGFVKLAVDVPGGRTLVDNLRAETRPTLLLVDDLPEFGRELNELIDGSAFPHVRMVAAGRVDRIVSPPNGYDSGAAMVKKLTGARLSLMPDIGGYDPISTTDVFDYGASRPARLRGFLRTSGGYQLVQT